ncbi:MAG: reactive intermediate/imine deaminase, partial [Gammaproteobacteria bacterium]|nr:reactive intermediate/imine deaminase [Gammaproteobacteria bacterium]NIW97086.1 reactive intermediate/imine deaminase [Phycisphaerae bacterium]
MMKTVISTENAPAAVGPYSQAMVVEGGELVFTAGNIALDPVTGKMVEGDVA